LGASSRAALPATVPQPLPDKLSPAVLPLQRVLISYRREDSQGITGRIFDRLVAHYGREAIFWDVDSVPLGVDFREYIADILDHSEIILVVVGDHWLGSGRNRLVEPTDNVRIEVETALQKKVPVVPLLVGGAAMPHVEDLPDGVK